MNIAYLLPTLNHVRFHKRINNLKRFFHKTKVIGYQRKSYPNKELNVHELIKLGEINRGNYIKRIIPLLKSFSIIYRSSKDVDVIYAFSMDLLLIGFLVSFFSNKILIYEIGDIRSIFIGDRFINKFFRFIERFLVNRIDILVVTSKEYINGYFYKVQKHKIPNKKVHLIENKLDIETNKIKTHNLYNKKKITIGWFGVLRCQRSYNILCQLAKRNNKLKVYLRGIPRNIDDFEKRINHINNLVYEGPYLNPDDLSEIYNKIDIVWACYPYQSQDLSNWRWARTNRLYEALFFNKPIIVQKNSADSKIINKYEIGFEVDISDINNTINSIETNLTIKNLKKYYKNLNEIPEEIYKFNEEHENLFNKVKEIR